MVTKVLKSYRHLAQLTRFYDRYHGGLVEDSLWQKLNKTGNISIRDWYHAAFPDDPVWKDMDPQPEFVDLALFIDAGMDVYFLLGVGDSTVRERAFVHLAELLDVPYKTVYNRWLTA